MGNFSKRLVRRGGKASANASEDALVASARAFIRRPGGAVALRLAGDAAILLEARAEIAEDAPLRACGPGCAYCCHLPVTLSVPEALRIVAHFAAQTAETSNQIYAAIRAADDANRSQSDDALYLARRPCVFLDASQQCTIYPVRPLACRGHASRDRQACAAAHEAPDDLELAAQIPIDSALRAEKDRTKTTLGVTLLAAGRDALDYELHALLRVLIDQPAVTTAWLAGHTDELPARVLAVSRDAHQRLQALASASAD